MNSPGGFVGFPVSRIGLGVFSGARRFNEPPRFLEAQAHIAGEVSVRKSGALETLQSPAKKRSRNQDGLTRGRT